jgi:hypothetical protein
MLSSWGCRLVYVHRLRCARRESSSCAAYLAWLEIGVDGWMTPVPWVLFLSERGVERCDSELCGGWWWSVEECASWPNIRMTLMSADCLSHRSSTLLFPFTSNLFNMMLVCLYVLLIIFILEKNANVFVTQGKCLNWCDSGALILIMCYQDEIPSLSFPLSSTESFNITHCDVPGE